MPGRHVQVPVPRGTDMSVVWSSLCVTDHVLPSQATRGLASDIAGIQVAVVHVGKSVVEIIRVELGWLRWVCPVSGDHGTMCGHIAADGKRPNG